MYETFEHTADLGLRVRAADLDSLFAEGARGLMSIAVSNLEAVRHVQEKVIRLESAPWDELLFDWLNELLYTFEVERLVLAGFDVRVSNEGLKAVARGEGIDAERHRLENEVKAITYHGLKVEQVEGGWLAEVIVDI